jgi:hypothetical protein
MHPVFLVETGLGIGELFAFEERLNGVRIAVVEEGVGDLLALIESPFAQFGGMEGNRHQNRTAQKVCEMWGVFEHPGEIFEDIKTLMVFEGMEEAAPRAFCEEEGFSFFKDRCEFGAVRAFAGCNNGSEKGIAAGFTGGGCTEL